MKGHYERRVAYSKEDDGWIAAAPELRGCSAFGETPARALQELEAAIDLWLEAAREERWAIPIPVSEKDPKGRFLLRMPKTLQRDLMLEAASEGLSLNQYLVYLLAEGHRRGGPGGASVAMDKAGRKAGVRRK